VLGVVGWANGFIVNPTTLPEDHVGLRKARSPTYINWSKTASAVLKG